MVYVVITDRDCIDPLKSSGAIIFEQSTTDSVDLVQKKALMLNGTYGQAYIGEVSNIQKVEKFNPRTGKPLVSVPQEIYKELVEKLGEDFIENLPFVIDFDLPF